MFQKGFTLLEIVVVLTIVGLITAISTPRLSLLYDRFEFGLERDDVVSQLKVLGYKAYKSGQSFTLKEAFEQTELMEIESGWSIIEGEEIAYSNIGVCQGGVVRLSKNKFELQLELLPPLCIPRMKNPN